MTIVVDKKSTLRYSVLGTNETKRTELLAKIKEAEGIKQNESEQDEAKQTILAHSGHTVGSDFT